MCCSDSPLQRQLPARLQAAESHIALPARTLEHWRQKKNRGQKKKRGKKKKRGQKRTKKDENQQKEEEGAKKNKKRGKARKRRREGTWKLRTRLARWAASKLGGGGDDYGGEGDGDGEDDGGGDDDDDGDDDENLYTPPLAPTRQTLGSSREVAKDPANTFQVSIVIIIAYIQKAKSLIQPRIKCDISMCLSNDWKHIDSDSL